jgi:hypothetical protein
MKRTRSAVAAAVLLSMMALMFLGGSFEKSGTVLLMVFRMEGVKHTYEVSFSSN